MQSIKDFANGNTLMLAVMYFLVGLVMLVCGSGSISLIFWLSGIVFIIMGIVQIVLKSVDVKGGAITIVVGIILVVIANVPALADVLVGIVLVLSALPSLIGSSDTLARKFGIKAIDTGNSNFNKIVTVVLLIIGICLIGAFFIGGLGSIADILIRIGGVVLLALGILCIMQAVKN